MPKFEYMTCNLDLKDETAEEFLNKINKFGEMSWEVICILPTLLSDFNKLLLKRERR